MQSAYLHETFGGDLRVQYIKHFGVRKLSYRHRAAPRQMGRGSIVALGVVYVVVGMIALPSLGLVAATAASVFVVGIMMMIAGVVEVLNAFRVKSWSRFFLWLLLGALYVVAGFVTLENPALAAVLLTLMLGIALVVAGIIRIILAFSMNEEKPWVAIALSAVVTFLLGLVILVHWPVSSLYVLGLPLGNDLVFAGAAWISAGLGLRSST